MSSKENRHRPWAARLRSWSVQLLLVLAVVWALELYLSRDSVGTDVPEFDVVTLDGGRFTSASLQGGPAIIHFWASWCPVCEVEQGMINNLADDASMVTVAMQSGSDKEVRDYLKQKGVAYPVVNDDAGELARRFGVHAVPASFVADKDGKVRFVTRGYTTGWGLRLRLWLAGLF